MKMVLFFSIFFAVTMLATPPSGRFIISTSGNTVFDTKTELEWQKTSMGGAMTFSAAGAHCLTLNIDGTGWRLPTVGELSTLVEVAGTSVNHMPDVFNLEPLDYYWTSTRNASSLNTVWAVNFGDGIVYNYDTVDIVTSLLVRCVR